MTLKFDRWHWKSKGHIFYAASSFVHHFKAINEYKLKLQSRSTQFGSNSMIFFVPCDLEIWWMTLHKANLRNLVAATGLIIILKLDSNHWFFSLCDLEIWWMTSKTIGHLFYTTSSFMHHFQSIGEFKLELQSGNAQLGSKSAIFSLCDLEIWQMTLKNNRAPLLYNIKLLHHFKAICEFKLELQSWNAQFGSKSVIFCPMSVTLKFNGWPS